MTGFRVVNLSRLRSAQPQPNGRKWNRATVQRFNHSPLEGESQKPSRSLSRCPELVEGCRKVVEGPAMADTVISPRNLPYGRMPPRPFYLR